MRRRLGGLRTNVVETLTIKSLRIHLRRHCNRIRGLLPQRAVIIWLGIGVLGDFIVMVIVEDVVIFWLFVTGEKERKLALGTSLSGNIAQART